MKKKKPEEVVVEAVNDLFIRDIEKLLFDHKKYDIASLLMKSMGMNKKEINKKQPKNRNTDLFFFTFNCHF